MKNQQLSLEKTSQAQPDLELALTVLEQGDFQERWDIAKILSKFGEVAIAPLIQILEDEQKDLELRWFAARILGEFNHPEVVITLVKVLQNTEDEDLANIAAQALANLGNSSIEGLTNLLLQPESRRLATCALAQICRPEVIPPLLTVVKDPDVAVRSAAIEALSNFHDPRITPIFIEALNDPAASVRKEAVIALGFRTDLGPKLDLFDYLKPPLYDFNLEVCQQAAIALGRLGTDEAATALFTVLQSPATPIPLQVSMIQVLGWMETATSLEYLQQVLFKSPAESSLEIIQVLGRIEKNQLKAKAAQILLDFFNSGHTLVSKTTIKQALAHTWGKLAEKSAIEALIQLQEDGEPRVRLHAIAALKLLRN